MMETAHQVSPEEIMALHDGELSGERAQQVSAHAEACAECRELTESFQATAKSLATWTINEVPRALGNDLVAATTAKPPRRRVILTLGFATSALMGMFLLVMSAGRYERSTSRARRGVSQSRQMEVTPLEMDDYVAKAEKAGGGGGDRSVITLQQLQSEPRGATAEQMPMIARTAELHIVVGKLEVARASVEEMLVRHRGYAASLHVADAQNSTRTLNASLRIPSQDLDSALSEMKALGHVTTEAQAGEEVTAEHADLVARLKNSRETETRLQDILRTRTGKVGDVLEVEQEIARVRGEIEGMESELKILEHRVDFATITLSVSEEYKAQVSDSTPGMATRFHNAAVSGFESAVASGVGLLLWLMETLPSLLLWVAILGVPAWWFWRRTRRALASVS